MRKNSASMTMKQPTKENTMLGRTQLSTAQHHGARRKEGGGERAATGVKGRGKEVQRQQGYDAAHEGKHHDDWGGGRNLKTSVGKVNPDGALTGFHKTRMVAHRFFCKQLCRLTIRVRNGT